MSYRSLVRPLLILVGTAPLAVGGVAVASAATGAGDPPPDTIVEITGDAGNGFHIHHFDGSTDFPPTDSEAIAECTEYDTQVARVKCKAEVRTYYRDLGATQQALDYAHQQAA